MSAADAHASCSRAIIELVAVALDVLVTSSSSAQLRGLVGRAVDERLAALVDELVVEELASRKRTLTRFARLARRRDDQAEKFGDALRALSNLRERHRPPNLKREYLRLRCM